MKYFYVPAPIYTVLRNNGFKGREFIDVRKLLDILSPEDLSFYLWSNLQPERVLPAPVIEKSRNVLMYGGVTVEETKCIDKAPVIVPWDQDVFLSDDVKRDVSRLINDYCVNGTAPQLDLDGMELTCEIFWLEGGQVTLFTHIPTVDNMCDPCEREHGFYLRLAQQQLQFNTFQDMAKQPWFQGYLISLKQSIAAK